ncbi:MAG TPA: class I SAM-dependent methyltransferase [Mucilaginibacter sp.]
MSIERYYNNKITPWTGEHLHRYTEAKKFVKPGDCVLDIACGSGYGANILSEVPKAAIYAGDIDCNSIANCKVEWQGNKSVQFEVMDATSLRFDDGFFDAIISLETIEHLTGYKKMVAEFARVAKQDGVVVISTPNIKVSSPDGKVMNPYHTQEFTYDELKDILKAEFSEVTISGQKYTRYENKGGSSFKQFIEKLLLTRGIRKLPYSLRNGIFKLLFKTPLYPEIREYQLFENKDFIEKNCHVLFAVCKK